MSRYKINSEQLMFEALKASKASLTINQIVKVILAKHPESLTGKTPNKSLYSVIYNRENMREDRGFPRLFTKEKKGLTSYYSINNKGENFVGKKIQVLSK